MNITPVIFIVMQYVHVLLDPLSLCGFTTLSHAAGYRDSLADWASENEIIIHFLTHLPGMKINLITSTVHYLLLL